jgi:protein-S-isoprenylcysteine O-methyltransferase Ste14
VQRPASSSHRLAAAWFAFQGIAVLAWWALLAARPQARAAFLPPENHPSALAAFALPDLFLLAGGSLVTAALARLGNAWALPLAWLVAGAIDYATFHVLAWAAIAGGGWIGFLLMAPSGLLSTAFALQLASARLPLFRRARAASPAWNIAKTALQILAFWTFFLALVPALLLRFEAAVGVQRFTFPGRTALSAFLFVALGAWGLACGITLARSGQGTPLPFDAPRRLVVEGPYAYVRNPMAIASLGQGLCVGLGTGSWTVIAYAVFGTLVWNFIVRPAEEADLEKSFGSAFVRYRQAVRCWLPRMHPYQEQPDLRDGGRATGPRAGFPPAAR